MASVDRDYVKNNSRVQLCYDVYSNLYISVVMREFMHQDMYERDEGVDISPTVLIARINKCVDAFLSELETFYKSTASEDGED